MGCNLNNIEVLEMERKIIIQSDKGKLGDSQARHAT